MIIDDYGEDEAIQKGQRQSGKEKKEGGNLIGLFEWEDHGGLPFL